MPPSEATRGLDDLALAVYLERLFQGRRVLWLGDASTGAPDRAARVATTVLAADPRAIADRVERENLSIVRLSQGSPLPAGPYDVVVVPDLPATGLATADRIRQLSGALARGGVLVVASSNADASVRLGRSPEVAPLAYEALYELLAERFPAVRMLGQAPFVGYTVADFSATGQPSVVFDGSLLGDASETPERFVALCGDAEIVLDAYAVVQVSARSALATAPVSRSHATFESDTERQLGVLRDEVRAARERSEHLSRELDEQRSQIRRPRAPSERPPAPPSAPAFDPRLAEVEAQLRLSRDQRDAGNVHAEELEATLSQRTAALADLDGEIERLRMELSSVRDESETRVSALRIAREELEKLRATPASPPEDYGRIEASLRERAQEIIALHAEIERRETLVRDVVEELRSLREGQLVDETSAGADAERRLAETSARTAELEAQLRTLKADREAAIQRALRAETERTEAGFRADEALGKLAEVAEQQGRADEERGRREAELSGFVRGLRARAAELEEMRGQAEGRVGLLRLDLEFAQAANLSLERAMADLREQFEFQLVRATSAPGLDVSPIERSESELAVLRGERDGLRARLDDREAALLALQSAAPAAAAQAGGAATSGAEPSGAETSTAQTSSAGPADAELAAQLATAERDREALESRASELAAALAAAEARASSERDRANDLVARIDTREKSLKSLETDAEERERDVRSATERTAALEADLRRLTAALGDARGSLAALGTSIDANAGAARQTLSGAIEEASDGYDVSEAGLLRQRIDALGHEASDRDVLLRSLTAQLQDRDDRMRTLEQKALGASALETAARGADDEVRRALVDLQDRAAKLAEDLTREREARRAAEAATSTPRADADGEVRRLHELLGGRDAELLLVQGKMRSSEREIRAVRDAVAQARASLEDLLATATTSGDASSADRVGSLLRLLSRF